MKRLVLTLASMFALAAAVPAHAGMYTYNLNKTINGDTAVGPIVATVKDTVANTVQLTMSLVGVPTAEYVQTWLFNFSGGATTTTLADLSFARDNSSTGPAAADITISKSANAYGNNNTPGFGANSSGLFDIQFKFATANSGGGIHRFNGGETLVYNITAAGGKTLTASMFNITSASPYNAAGPYYTAAHMAAIPDADSGAMGANSSITGVPEPSSVVLAGLASLAGIAGYVRRRHRPGA